MLKINLDKAKEVKKNMVRDERAPLLANLDVEYVRALETGDTAKQKAIVMQKQALRDATKSSSILNAKDVDSLSAADPIREAIKGVVVEHKNLLS